MARPPDKKPISGWLMELLVIAGQGAQPEGSVIAYAVTESPISTARLFPLATKVSWKVGDLLGMFTFCTVQASDQAVSLEGLYKGHAVLMSLAFMRETHHAVDGRMAFGKPVQVPPMGVDFEP